MLCIHLKERTWILTIIFVVSTISPVSIAFLQPFMPALIGTFGYEGVLAGHYIGILETAFFVGQILGSYFIGYCSYHKSTLTLLQATCVVNIVLLVFFGLSTSFGFALLIRFFIGFFAVLNILIKSAIWQTCEETAHTSGIQMMLVGNQLGSFIAPLIGAYFWDFYKIFDDSSAWKYTLKTYPCLLPSLVSAGYTTAVLFFFRLMEKRVLRSYVGYNRIGDRSCGESLTREAKFSEKLSYSRILRNSKVRVAIGVHFFYSLSNSGLRQLFPLFLSTSAIRGGVDFNSNQIGHFLFLSGIPCLFFQFFLFHKVVQNRSILKVVRYCVLCLFFSSLTFPLNYMLINSASHKILYFGLFMSHVAYGISKTTFTGVISILINNSVDLYDVGGVNAISTLFISIGRSMAPILFGSIFSWSIKVSPDYNSVGTSFPFCLAALANLSSFVYSFYF